MSRITTGNDFELGITLTKDDKTFVIDPGATLKAVVVSADHATRYFDPVNVSPATPGTDYSQSLVIVKFSAALTAAIQRQGPAKIEIELTDAAGVIHPSWFVDVRVVKGHIG